MEKRRYTAGLQTFSDFIENEYVYIDKTDLMWKMTQLSKYVFLSRPRRFGKTLLSYTLHSFFEGKRDLFKGLKVMELEKQWKSYPVIHLDLSMAKEEMDENGLTSKLMLILNDYAKIYGKEENESTPGGLLRGIIKRAYEATGSKVVVIVDEYDAPMLGVMHEEQTLTLFRKIMQEFFIPLKASDPMLQFCFITGITKFSQLSIFSTLNNLTNISMHPDFATICGITEEEICTQLTDGIKCLAKRYETTDEEIHDLLKNKYDGYRFSEDKEAVFNPYSLMKAFLMERIENYWFESGTPTYLFKQMQFFNTDITDLDHIEVPSPAFDRPSESMNDALPLLYQSGYLTIKDYNKESQIYTLAIPNQEVRVGFSEGLLPIYAGMDAYRTQTGFALKFWRALKQDDINQALEELKTFLYSPPYIMGFKDKLNDINTKEGFYEYTLYLIFSMLNVYVHTQLRCAGGRMDVIVHMPHTTYVMELKMRGTAQEALKQIDEKNYALPFNTDGKKVVKVGIIFSTETKNIKEWKVEEL